MISAFQNCSKFENQTYFGKWATLQFRARIMIWIVGKPGQGPRCEGANRCILKLVDYSWKVYYWIKYFYLPQVFQNPKEVPEVSSSLDTY